MSSAGGPVTPEPARFAPRLGALLVDWLACSLIAAAFLGYTWSGSSGDGFLPLLVFAAENLVLVGTIGATLGHRLLGLRVVDEQGGTPGPVQALIRTVLLCLVVPALVSNEQGRGWHDRAAGTWIVRTRR